MSQPKFSKNYLIHASLAIFVTVLWSSSWLLIKWGLQDIPPLLFSGLRYFVASLVLLGLIFSQKTRRRELFNINKSSYVTYGLYGLIFVTITQGAQFVSLLYLPAISVSLILSLTVIAVLLLSFVFLQEIPTRFQFLLIFVTLIGISLYFYDKLAGTGIDTLNLFGVLIAVMGMLANASSFILGRSINKSKTVSPLLLTGISMTIGSIFLLLLSVLFETIPALSLTSIFYIVYLALVNTALAFTIWNKTMQHLRAIDSTLINNLMTPQIVFIALLFFGEIPSFLDWIGIILIILSVFFIQIHQAQQQES